VRAKGVAPVDPASKPGVRGVAPVPGALSVPKPKPRTSVWRSVPTPSVLFEGGLPATAHEMDVPEKPHRLRRAALPTVSAVLAAIIAGGSYLAIAGIAATEPDKGRWGASPPPAAPEAVEGAGNAERPPGDPFGGVTTAARGVPTRVRVAAIGLDSPLETLHVGEGDALQPPQRFDRAGWYAEGTAPGDIGPAVIAGHVDSKAGPAVFYRLRELTAGDRIEVSRGGRVLRFTVIRTAWYPKNAFPTEQVYGPTPDRQLRLITCGGVFDRRLRSYKDNLVVYAVAG
jgi:hypothetical protein